MKGLGIQKCENEDFDSIREAVMTDPVHQAISTEVPLGPTPHHI
jgi:hypothetical protein